MAALAERQQSPLTAGGAVMGPTLTATEPSMANGVWSPLQLVMDLLTLGKPWVSIWLCKSWILSEYIQKLLGTLTDTYVLC